MAENSSRSPDRKLGLIAPLSIAAAIAVVVLAAVLLGVPGPEEPPPAQPPEAPAPTPVATPRPAPEPTLVRRDLVDAANALAASYAVDGAAAAPGKEPLAGRKFVLRIPFGCEGPQVRPGAAQAYYEFNPERRTVRVVARPAVWTTLPVVQETTSPNRIETVEGFWVPQPWSPAEGCPSPRDKPLPASPTPAAAETLGLARIFESSESRVGRRGERPYEHVMKLDDGESLPLAQGFRLVLEGRFATFPDGRVAHCWSETTAHRPVCVYAVRFDRVAFETGERGRMLAEWRE